MRMRRMTLSLAAVSALVLAACGGEGEAPEEPTAPTEEETEEPAEGQEPAPEEEGEGEAGGEGEAVEATPLDCNAVEVIVPYSPGGGSDQQVRRLQPALEEALGVSLNVVYQEGGDGAVGWNALNNSEPDGCTISNVVAPNIVNVSETSEDVGFEAADFEYLGWTEYSPNIIAVANDSEYETIEQYLEDAQANPGEVTISGVGAVGELLISEVVAATDADLTFVPVSGGVGSIIPQIVGGHIDSAISGFSLLDGDQLRPLALSGTEPVENLPDVPTFEEAGYPGVDLVTSWGFIAPPGTPEGIVATWNDAIQQAMEDPEVQEAYAERNFITLVQSVEEAQAYFEEQRDAALSAMEGMEG